MAEFTLVHASDLHLAAQANVLNAYDLNGMAALRERARTDGWREAIRLSSFNPDVAYAFGAKIVEMAADLDAVIFTGDVATTGSLEDMVAAESFFFGHPTEPWAVDLEKAVPALVDPRGMPRCVLMPGNHDRYKPFGYLPGSQEFEKIFGNYWDFGQVRPIPKWHAKHRYVRSTRIEKGDAVLGICRADFSLMHAWDAERAYDPRAYLGQGRVTTKALRELEDQTGRLRAMEPEKKTDVIWCIHFAPHYPGISEGLKLIDEEKLLAAADRCDIKLILSGHTHEFNSYVVYHAENRRKTRVVCCGTTAGIPGKTGYCFLHLKVDIDGLGEPRITQHGWDEHGGDFL